MMGNIYAIGVICHVMSWILIFDEMEKERKKKKEDIDEI